MLGDEQRLTCEDCRELAFANGDVPECAACNGKKPEYLYRLNAEALEIWRVLDLHGRPLDTFGGFPMPLRLEDVRQECARSRDPEAMRSRVLLLEREMYKLRVAAKIEEDKTKRPKA